MFTQLTPTSASVTHSYGPVPISCTSVAAQSKSNSINPASASGLNAFVGVG
ncbi:MAG TPA: hypothetical protein PKD00_11005 [Burkholderiales bacterium]|nr:hypothetical protein [Burkholderiales bacterium]